jgi:hypothetical protein
MEDRAVNDELTKKEQNTKRALENASRINKRQKARTGT